MLIASISAPRRDAILAAASACEEHADLLELRIDGMEPGEREHLGEILAALPGPSLATCRRSDDGGAFTGSEDERCALLRRAAEAGADWLDVEWGTDAERLIEGVRGARFILSHHDWERTPGDLGFLHRRLAARAGVSLVKLVTRARSLGDNLVVRRLLGESPGRVPLAAFCTGDAGALSRILGLAWGSAAVYGAVGDPAAPGQIPVAEMHTLYRVKQISAATRLLGVAGDPVGHSLSPAVHNAALAHRGLDFVYLPLPVARVEELLSVAAALPLRGFSVTLPHKVDICAALDRMEPAAERIGAVNTVLRDGDAWVGFNTDARGAVEPLAARVELEGCAVAVLGAGGAARALVHELVERRARVTVFNRTEDRAQELAEATGAAWRPLAALEDHPYDVLVHATPVGMRPGVDATPLPEEWLRGRLVYDLVYNPRETALLRAARARGIAVLEGLEMFLAQAAEQFRLFTRVEAPADVMRRSAEEALEVRGA